jgi:hypothetical protein
LCIASTIPVNTINGMSFFTFCIVALLATGFLIGPKKQCIKMIDPTRHWSTAFYLFMLIVVLVVALLKQNVFLVLFLLFIEILAAIWYSLSFVPFGRKIVLKFLRKIGICFPCFYVYDSATEAYKSSSSSGGTTSQRFSNMLGGGDEK